MKVNGHEIKPNAHLSGADLSWADLSGVGLYKADLTRADLTGANLSWAQLFEANLTGALLFGANLTGAKFDPTSLLKSQWGELSDETTLALMRLDASAHPHPEKFDEWAKGGMCPYSNEIVRRIVNFKTKRELWSPGPPPTIWEAVKMILDEKCPGWRL